MADMGKATTLGGMTTKVNDLHFGRDSSPLFSHVFIVCLSFECSCSIHYLLILPSFSDPRLSFAFGLSCASHGRNADSDDVAGVLSELDGRVGTGLRTK